MPKNRLEAFSDGVIAIVITLLVLEIHIPALPAHANNKEMLQALWALFPSFIAYIVSFLVCAVWWVSHHNFIHDVLHVDRPLLWANNVFLLWLAFIPFPTALLGQHPNQPVAAALYGFICALAGASFCWMRWYASLRARLMTDLPEPELRRRLRISASSPFLYLAGALCSFVLPAVAICIYVFVPFYFAVTALAGRRPEPETR